MSVSVRHKGHKDTSRWYKPGEKTPFRNDTECGTEKGNSKVMVFVNCMKRL